jgi:hypothetical protein
MGVDEARDHQPVGRIDDHGLGRRGKARRADLGDRAVDDQDVGQASLSFRGVDQQSVANYLGFG